MRTQTVHILLHLARETGGKIDIMWFEDVSLGALNDVLKLHMHQVCIGFLAVRSNDNII